MERSQQHITELYRKYYAHLRNYCIVLLEYQPQYIQHADDCVQDAFYQALRHPDKVLGAANSYAWLAKCCKNSCYKLRRRKEIVERKLGKQNVISAEEDIPDPTDHVMRWLCHREAVDILHQLIASLTPLEYAVFRDYYQNDMSLKETAKENRITLLSAQGAVQRIRAKAKKLKNIENG